MSQTILFDTHFHLDDSDPVAVVAAARQAGVEHLLAAATHQADSERLTQAVATCPGLVVTVGVHPHETARFDGDLAPFRELASRPGVVAVGEVGLDFHYNHSSPDVQRRVFAQFLDLARDLRLPTVVHCREAYDDCLRILRDHADPGLGLDVHSYTGTPEWAERFLALGACLAFNGIVTFRNADNVRQALAVVPDDRLLAETDAPWLAPVPYRGQRNQPAYVREVVQALANLRHRSFDDMARLTTANGLRLFRLPPGCPVSSAPG